MGKIKLCCGICSEIRIQYHQISCTINTIILVIVDNKVKAVPVAIEGYGIIYNKEITWFQECLGHAYFGLGKYTNALDYERHVANSKFNEAATCILQNLSGNFTKDEDKDKLNKRSIHILNECGIFPKHIYDCMYNYTKEDEKEYDEFCNNMYGKIFFHENEKPINEG